ncbi:hypothetical protein [Micromonospora foliorum]|uniref:hypothetical protein n=1 Tax=Micromonospora foliorum TaxID=2911210 RepID=UPI001EE7EDB9|nr:hypothetical protein [Micromonospora foliorum]MCG5436799.1 hypothetical protein [Micromonospora foliorum]
MTLILSGSGVLVAIVAISYSRRALFPAKREIRIGWVKPTPLVGTSSTERVSLLVEVNNQVLTAPHLTHVEILIAGRHDIKSSDFDQGKPLELNFGSTAALASVQAVTPEVFSAKGSKVLLRPALLKRGWRLSFDVITEGMPNDLKTSDHLADTKVFAAEVPSMAAFWKREFRRTYIAFLALAVVTGFLVTQTYLITRQYEESSDTWYELNRKIMDLCGI